MDWTNTPRRNGIRSPVESFFMVIFATMIHAGRPLTPDQGGIKDLKLRWVSSAFYQNCPNEGVCQSESDSQFEMEVRLNPEGLG